MRHLHAGFAMVALVLTLACGSSSSTSHLSPNASSTPASASPSAVTTSQAFPSPSPGVTASVAAVPLSCSSTPAAGEHLALVTLRGSSNVVVRDVTDVSHPSSRCTFKGGGYFRFYNATHVSYIVMASGDLGASGALYLADLRTRTTSLVRAWSDGGFESWIYAWSPNGQYLTYISSDSSGAQWHMLSAAGDRKLLDLGTIPGRDVDPNGDDATVGFSADGQFVAVEQTFTQGKGATGSAPPIQVNRVSDGSVAYSRTDGTMAAWAGAGARLYFRTGAGVESWSPGGGVTSASAGTKWIRPYASPDGSRIAFSVLNAQQNHVSEVLDLTSGAIHSLSANPRVGAAFLNASLVWYSGESICTTATPCGLVPPQSGQTYIYDLGSDVETVSIDTGFYDSWPHNVGQS